MGFVDCIGQLQCVKCRKWIDANKAYQLFEDDGEFEFFGDDELLLPNGYMLEGDMKENAKLHGAFAVLNVQTNSKTKIFFEPPTEM